MRRIRLLGIVVLVIAASLLFSRPAYAYMDPGPAIPFVAISFTGPYGFDNKV